MPAPNRNRYSDDYGGGSSAIRTLGAFLLCAVLSFALGFFVLARFWSNKPKADADGLEKSVVAMANDHGLSLNGNNRPAPMRTALPAAQPTPHLVPPRIDPAEDEVQKPANVDENQDTKKPTDPGTDPGKDNLPDPSNPAVKPGDSTQTNPPTPAEETKPKRHKKNIPTEETQTSKAPDDEVAPPESTDDVNDDHTPRHKRPAPVVTETTGGLYRVQIGVYSTREKAEEQAKLAADKGFETTIHTVTTGDRTLYRVQHSAHRNKANAEIEKQRLVDAGFDAYIANP